MSYFTVSIHNVTNSGSCSTAEITTVKVFGTQKLNYPNKVPFRYSTLG